VSANNRLARWALALQPYKFEINYKEGKKLTAADGISRRPFPEPVVEEEDEEIAEDSYIAQIDTDIFDSVTDNTMESNNAKKKWTVITFDHKKNVCQEPDVSTEDELLNINEPVDITSGYNIQELQRKCPDFIPIFDYIENGILPDDDKSARKLILESEQFLIDDGILYHIFHPRTKRLNVIKPTVQQLCVPGVLREELLTAYHDNNAHVGRERLYNTLKFKYYFPRMYTSVIEYVSSCDVCQRTKTSPHTKKAPLKPLEVVEPFGRLHLDFVGPLPKTPEGFRHILVIVDSASLWCEAFPTKTTNAEEVAHILYKEIISRYGVMRQLLTDNGSSFRNKLIAELCRLLKIKHTFSSPHHPQGDGKCERMNQTIIKSLKLMCKDQTDWAENITPVLMSYRGTATLPTGISPHYVLFGREMNLGIDITLMNEFHKAPDIQSYTAELLPRLKLTHDIIKQNLQDSQVKMKKYYDVKSEEPKFEIGSKVLLHDPTTKQGESPKFKRRWMGPYMIIHKSDDGLLYKLRHCDTGREQRSMIHGNRLKAYNDDRDLFYNRHNIVKPIHKQNSDLCQPNADSGEWFEIKKVTSRKFLNGKETFLVWWQDGSKSRVDATDVSEYAKEMYFINLKKKNRRKR